MAQIGVSGAGSPRYPDILNSRPRTYVAPPTVISSPEAHQLRNVKSDLAAPTRKWATSDTTAAQMTPGVPPSQKNGSTGMRAPTPVLTPAASAACAGCPPALTPPSSSLTS